MLRKGRHQVAVLTISVLLVASAPAFAAAGSHTGAKPAAVAESGHSGIFARAWQWVQALWAEQGACLDPDGKCTSAPPVHTDNGGCIDPDGRCTSAPAPTVHTDNGSCIDPNGKPCTASPLG